MLPLRAENKQSASSVQVQSGRVSTNTQTSCSGIVENSEEFNVNKPVSLDTNRAIEIRYFGIRSMLSHLVFMAPARVVARWIVEMGSSFRIPFVRVHSRPCAQRQSRNRIFNQSRIVFINHQRHTLCECRAFLITPTQLRWAVRVFPSSLHNRSMAWSQNIQIMFRNKFGLVRPCVRWCVCVCPCYFRWRSTVFLDKKLPYHHGHPFVLLHWWIYDFGNYFWLENVFDWFFHSHFHFQCVTTVAASGLILSSLSLSLFLSFFSPFIRMSYREIVVLRKPNLCVI